jgi:hypothetical protein
VTPRERLLAAMRGEAADRVSVTLYEFSHLDDNRPRGDAGYAALIGMQREMGETFAHCHVDFGTGVGDPNSVREAVERSAGAVVRTVTVSTPEGDLTGVSRREPGNITWWQVKPLIETAEDCRKWLSLPPVPARPDVKRIKAMQRDLGEEGLVLLGPGDALGLVCGMFHFDRFVMLLMEDAGLVDAMLAAMAERLNAGLRQVCAQVAGVCVRFWGPEYAGAPLLNPHKHFERLVTRHDREAIRIVNESGNFSVLHCHGCLGDILDPIADLGPTALEPLEVLPAATADVTMEQVKSRLGGKTCLMGGIQASELELGGPEDIDRRVREILEAGAPGGRFVLLPTSAPIAHPLPPRLVENYRTYFRAAHAYGRYA